MSYQSFMNENFYRNDLKYYSKDDTKVKAPRGRFSPPYPSKEDINNGYTESGKLIYKNGISLQEGPFKSLWCRDHNDYRFDNHYILFYSTICMILALMSNISVGLIYILGMIYSYIFIFEIFVPAYSTEYFEYFIDTIIIQQSNLDIRGNKAAIYYSFPENKVDNNKINILLKKGFKFFTFRNDYYNEIVYVNDLANSVPEYKTSISGVHCIFLSPDEKYFIGTKEDYSEIVSTPGGAVDGGENILQTLERECMEEIGISPDYDKYPPVCVQINQIGHAREDDNNPINDCHYDLIVKGDGDPKANNEVHSAKWYLVEDLISFEMIDDSSRFVEVFIEVKGEDEAHKVKFSKAIYKNLKKFKDNTFIPCTINGSNVQFM